MKRYLGLILNMALTPKCDVKDYFTVEWTEHCPFHGKFLRESVSCKFAGCCMWMLLNLQQFL